MHVGGVRVRTPLWELVGIEHIVVLLEQALLELFQLMLIPFNFKPLEEAFTAMSLQGGEAFEMSGGIHDLELPHIGLVHVRKCQLILGR